MDDPKDMDIDPEIAAALGFSSFGESNASKKRKFYHDFSVVDDGNKAKPKAQQPEAGITGANMTQLGPRKRLGEDKQMSPSNGDTGDAAAAAAAATTATAAVAGDRSAQSADNIEKKGDQQSAPKPHKPKQKKTVVPTGLAQFLARGQALQEARDAEVAHQKSQQAAAPVDTPPRSSLPAKPPTAGNASIISASGEPDLIALRKGVRTETGDLAFFLPSFVEDPWSKLPGVQ